MRFTFDERRAVQAAAVLLRLSWMRQNYTWLLKVLYLADREALRQVGAPIAGASFCNMKNGPLASDVYHCIKQDSAHQVWADHIRKEGYDVVLVKDPGDEELSDFDVKLLTELFDRYKAYSYSRMIDVVHGLKEWEDPGATSTVLAPETILRGAGATDAEITDFERVNLQVNRAESFFS